MSDAMNGRHGRGYQPKGPPLDANGNLDVIAVFVGLATQLDEEFAARDARIEALEATLARPSWWARLVGWFKR
jgi:hypothetical protein